MTNPTEIAARTPQVGDVFYTFDINRRVYERDASGRANSGLIYREHFSPVYFVGIEKKSWLVTSGAPGTAGNQYLTYKVLPKKLYTPQQVDDAVWQNQHRYRISQAIQRCDVLTLKQVAGLIGYQEDCASD